MSKPVHGRQYWQDLFFPFLRWWPKVNRLTLKADLQAGLTGAVIALPQGVAFAAIAGMPPEYGLYAGMVPAIIAALYGSSWHLVSGPTTAASIVMYSVLSEHAAPGSSHYIQLALTLTIMVGVIQLSMGLVRFGAIVNFISHSVVVGFTAGAAIQIIASQLKHFLGLTLTRTGDLPHTLYTVLSHWREFNLFSVAAGLAAIIAGLLIKRFRPQFPYIIASMLFGSLIGFLLNTLFGMETAKIASIGALPSSLPPLSAPDLTLENIRLLAPAALATTLFALTEAVSIARSLADKSGQNLDGNQEFIGQGLSNIVGSFFSGYVATGSFNRSGLNYQAGARTPLAAIFAGLLLIVVVLLVAPLAAYLPLSVMAGILFLVAWGLIDFVHIRKILLSSTYESLILCTTFFCDPLPRSGFRHPARGHAVAGPLPQPHLASPYPHPGPGSPSPRAPLHHRSQAAGMPAAQNRPDRRFPVFRRHQSCQGGPELDAACQPRPETPADRRKRHQSDRHDRRRTAA